MKKVGIITFHASHNYGSVLQAYALKNVISELGFECEIINFRTERQKDQYRPLTKRKGLKYIAKNSYFFIHYQSRNRKYQKFEKFISERLISSTQIEYSSLMELEKNPPLYDYYISGSDQIWNTAPSDADMSYFLPFVNKGIKIAYAPSFGQIGNISHKDEIAKYIADYDYLSVREEFGKNLIKEMTGREVPILPDPTLLIDAIAWESIATERLIEREYLFFYTLFATKEMIDIVKFISQKLDLPVVISNISNQYEIFSGFIKLRDAGPQDFLSLIKYAKFVCTTSFHGTVFSIIMNKPFFAINGMDDKRINTLLCSTGLTERSITKKDYDKKIEIAYKNYDYSVVNKSIMKQRNSANCYLKKALDLENKNERNM